MIACSVWVLMRPAEATEPPEGNSTVVVLLRVRKPGIAIPLNVTCVAVVDVGDFGRDSQLDPSLGQDDRSEIQGHAIGLLDEIRSWQTPDCTASLLSDRNRAAGQEFRGFAGDRGHGRLGERVGDALPLEGLQSGAEALAPLDPVQSRFGSGDGAVDGERVVEREASVWPAAAQVDAELLDDVAANFGDRDAQADLIGPADRQGVDHPSAGAAGPTCHRSRWRWRLLEPFETEIELPGRLRTPPNC